MLKYSSGFCFAKAGHLTIEKMYASKNFARQAVSEMYKCK